MRDVKAMCTHWFHVLQLDCHRGFTAKQQQANMRLGRGTSLAQNLSSATQYLYDLSQVTKPMIAFSFYLSPVTWQVCYSLTPSDFCPHCKSLGSRPLLHFTMICWERPSCQDGEERFLLQWQGAPVCLFPFPSRLCLLNLSKSPTQWWRRNSVFASSLQGIHRLSLCWWSRGKS